MKQKIILIVVFTLASFVTVQAKIILTTQLLDSILSHTVVKQTDTKMPSIDIIKFSNSSKNNNELIASITYLTIRPDIPKDAYLYLHNGYRVFLVFNNIYISSDLFDVLIKNTESRYTDILDSLKFWHSNRIGLVPLRIAIDVVSIKKCWHNQFHYKLRYSKIFPAGKTPKELLPVEKISDGGYEPDPPSKIFYNWKGEMLEKYKKSLIPKKPVIIKLKV